VWVSNQCGAITVDANGNYGWGSGPTTQAAVAGATNACLSQNGGNAACAWPVWFCSNGT
jgi:hypothetical protein